MTGFVKGVNDVYYNVRDMNRAVAFYHDVLGIKVVETDDWWTSLDVGGVRLGLHWSEGHEVPRVARDEHGAHAGATLTLRVDDIRVATKALEARGVTLLGPIQHAPWGSLVAFEDPDGNVLKLMQPPGAPKPAKKAVAKKTPAKKR
jgi:predicted enzyme related to lactoylglutathione lyase